MAQKYREYLQEANQLKKSALADKKYLILDLVGAVSIEKYVFGVKQPVVTPLTTYNDVVSIVKELKAEGVDNLVVNYIGALDGGLNNKMYSTVETESVLGTKKEFRAMIDYLEQEGVVFFLEANPIDIYNNGNGYDNNADTAMSFFGDYAFQYKYIIDSGRPDNATRWHILHPNRIPGFVNKFVDASVAAGIHNISLDRIPEIAPYKHGLFLNDISENIRRSYVNGAERYHNEAGDRQHNVGCCCKYCNGILSAIDAHHC
jgi:hypothetical protein